MYYDIYIFILLSVVSCLVMHSHFVRSYKPVMSVSGSKKHSILVFGVAFHACVYSAFAIVLWRYRGTFDQNEYVDLLFFCLFIINTAFLFLGGGVILASLSIAYCLHQTKYTNTLIKLGLGIVLPICFTLPSICVVYVIIFLVFGNSGVINLS